MHLFVKEAGSLTPDDLAELIASKAQENVRLEFKKEVPSSTEMLKKVSSMANTYGGYIIIGAEEDGKGNLIGYPGVVEQPSFKQTIIQWCQGGVYPPIAPLVSDAIASPDDPNRVVYVVFVAESLEAPHFLEGRKGAYVRTDEFSARFEARLASYEEIRHLANRRELALARRKSLFDRAECRYQALLEQDYSSDPHTVGSPGVLLQLAVVPAFPVVTLAAEGDLEQLLRNNRVTWRSVGFPSTREVLTQHESVLDCHSSYGFSVLEINTWGQIYYANEVERADGDDRYIHLYSFLGHILVYLAHARKVYGSITFDGIVTVRVKLTRLRGIRFRYDGMPEYREVVSRFDDELDIAVDVSASELRDNSEAVAKRLFRLIFFAVNWPDAVSDDAALERLVRRGREYNEFG